MINIIEDKDLIWEVENYDVILIGTSIYCTLGGGFQSKMRYKYPFIQTENDKTPYGDYRKLGKRLTFSKIKPIISLMYICDRGKYNRTVIDYDALEKCLLSANAEFSGLNVASTLIGVSSFEGNGDKEKCLDIINKSTSNINLTLYDYEQLSNFDEKKIYRLKLQEIKKVDKEKHKILKQNYNQYLKEHYLA